MKMWKNLLIGLLLIAVGVIVGLNAFGITHIDLFFDGWWTLFILVPSVVGLFRDKNKTAPVIGIVVGGLLLLMCLDVLTFTMLWKLALPTVLIAVGLVLIFKNVLGAGVNEKLKQLNGQIPGGKEFCATFGGQQVHFNGQVFEGAELSAVFGGIKCDLSGAVMHTDAVLNVSAIFGGVDILVPAGVKVIVKSTPLFGGVNNKTSYTAGQNAPTLYIQATCMFGGVTLI